MAARERKSKPQIVEILTVCQIITLFLPRDALLSTVYAVVVCLSVCVCVCVSVTLRYCIKTAKHRITQTKNTFDEKRAITRKRYKIDI